SLLHFMNLIAEFTFESFKRVRFSLEFPHSRFNICPEVLIAVTEHSESVPFRQFILWDATGSSSYHLQFNPFHLPAPALQNYYFNNIIIMNFTEKDLLYQLNTSCTIS